MPPEDLILLVLDKEGGSLGGRTLLQKRAYFLGIVLKLGLDYLPHYYGPYSPDVQNGLGRAKALGFVEERTSSFGVPDQDGFEVRRYDYVLTDDGREVVDLLKKTEPRECKDIQDALERLKEAGDDGNYVTLSIAAKTHHIVQRKHEAMTLDQIRAEAKTLGWHISQDDIDKAAEFLERLGLVERNS